MKGSHPPLPQENNNNNNNFLFYYCTSHTHTKITFYFSDKPVQSSRHLWISEVCQSEESSWVERQTGKSHQLGTMLCTQQKEWNSKSFFSGGLATLGCFNTLHLFLMKAWPNRQHKTWSCCSNAEGAIIRDNTLAHRGFFWGPRNSRLLEGDSVKALCIWTHVQSRCLLQK